MILLKLANKLFKFSREFSINKNLTHLKLGRGICTSQENM